LGERRIDVSTPTDTTVRTSELSPEQAIQLINRQIDRLQEMLKSPFNDPRIDAWESTTRDILDKTFGKPQGRPHQKTDDVLYAPSGPVRIGMTPGQIQMSRCT